MSVLVPDLEVFERIFKKVNSFQYRKECDINYCYTFSAAIQSEKKAGEFVKNILELNELSYIKRYREEKEPVLQNMLKLDLKADSIETLQLLKYLNCINYNIEIDTIKTGCNGTENNTIKPELIKSYELMKLAIQELQYTVINELTNYRDLKYND